MRGVGDARAIAVEIVGREAVILVVVGIVGGGFPVGDPLAERLVEDAAREIAIDLIGEGRGDVADLAARLADLRAHEERDDVAMRPAAQLDAVDAASHVLGNREAEIVGPAAIVQIVVVKMDGGILMRRGLRVGGWALARRRCRMREGSFVPTPSRPPPLSSAMPSGVSTSAKPAPVAGSRREITVCGPSSGRVGQISASTASAPDSVTSLAPSIRA